MNDELVCWPSYQVYKGLVRLICKTSNRLSSNLWLIKDRFCTIVWSRNGLINKIKWVALPLVIWSRHGLIKCDQVGYLSSPSIRTRPCDQDVLLFSCYQQEVDTNKQVIWLSNAQRGRFCSSLHHAQTWSLVSSMHLNRRCDISKEPRLSLRFINRLIPKIQNKFNCFIFFSVEETYYKAKNDWI